MREKIAKMREYQWHILKHYNYRLADIQAFVDKAKSLNLKSDLVLFLIYSLEIWIDFYTHLPASYKDYEVLDNV